MNDRSPIEPGPAGHRADAGASEGAHGLRLALAGILAGPVEADPEAPTAFLSSPGPDADTGPARHD